MERTVSAWVGSLLGLAASMLAACVPTQSAWSQDLEPRRWTHLPVGSSTFALGYAGQETDIFFNPLIGITDGTGDVNAWLARYNHAFEWGGKTARIDAILPYVSGTWQGLVDGEPGRRDINGGGDPWLRLSVNFYGSPALEGEAYRDFMTQNPVRTTVGASLAVSLPLGAYDAPELINVGRNRYTLRPQLGVLHQRGAWTYELTSSVFLYTDNDEFVDSTTLEQDPIWALQGHITRNFSGNLWIGAGLAYAAGGDVTIDGQRVDYEVDNLIWNLVAGYRLTASQSITLAWQQGRTQVDVGTDFDSWLLSWAYAWGR
jgi:hypothetical protein